MVTQTNDTTKEETFFYHSDHLGSTSYITDDHANITQYDAYLPYGELLVDEHITTLIVLSKVVKVVQVNNATDVRIAGSVLLPSTTYKAYLPNIDN